MWYIGNLKAPQSISMNFFFLIFVPVAEKSAWFREHVGPEVAASAEAWAEGRQEEEAADEGEGELPFPELLIRFTIRMVPSPFLLCQTLEMTKHNTL